MQDNYVLKTPTCEYENKSLSVQLDVLVSYSEDGSPHSIYYQGILMRLYKTGHRMDDTGDAADSPSLADDKLYYCMRSANDGRVWVDKDVTRLTHDGFGLSNKNLVEDGYTLCTPRATDSNNKDIGIQEVMLLRDYRGNPSDVYYKGMDFSFTGKTGQNIKCPTEKYWEMATALDGRLWINKDASILNEDSIGSAPEITNLAPVIKKIRAKAK